MVFLSVVYESASIKIDREALIIPLVQNNRKACDSLTGKIVQEKGGACNGVFTSIMPQTYTGDRLMWNIILEVKRENKIPSDHYISFKYYFPPWPTFSCSISELFSCCCF